MTDTQAAPPRQAVPLRRRLAQIQKTVPLVQIGVLVAVFAVAATAIDGLTQWYSIRSLLLLSALLGLAALGQTFVVLLGGLDMSVAGMIVLGAFVTTQLAGALSTPVAILIAVLLAALGGATSGYLSHRFGIDPLIVTLGMGGISAGAVVAWTGGQVTAAAPPELAPLVSPTATTFGLPIPPIIPLWIVVGIAAGLFLHRTRVGKSLYATGSNPRAATLAGVPVRAVWVGVFAFSAVAACLTGILLSGFSGATQTIGDPYLFQGFGAVIIGGTLFAGARGDYTHTMIGAMILTLVTTILVATGFERGDQQIFLGVLILLVVGVYGRQRRVRDRV